jgi:peptidoglycan-N-acetylglucosamine deacetylase
MDRKMTTKILLTFDVDLQLLWTGTFRRTTLGEVSRGEYGARVGLPRVLELLKKENIKATFFVPGKIAEIYPELILNIQSLGHEIGLHGYAHERWNELNSEQEEEIINKGKTVLEDLLSKEIIGFRSPAWNLNPWSAETLLKHGFKYDSSLMADDFSPYYLRIGDLVNLDGEIHFGKESGLLEIPVAWELDDFPYFSFTGRQTGLSSPHEVMKRWLEELNYAIKQSNSVFTLTMHPEIIGRGPRIEMLQEFIKKIKSNEGNINFCTASDCLDVDGISNRVLL